jgi:octaprenyl-diphosphate synthase
LGAAAACTAGPSAACPVEDSGESPHFPAEDYGKAAEKLGVGFQILDDVKNLTTGIPGKKRGDDVVEGKKSLPVLLFLHAHRDKLPFAKAFFEAAAKNGAGAPEVEELISALSTAGALREAEERGLALIGEAGEIFGRAAPGLDENCRKLLAGLPGLLG